MKINVGPFTYQIQIHPGPIPHEGQDCFGLCDNLTQVIYISDQLPHRQRLQVFFHELMHAWWYHFGLDADDEESIVDLVGMAMTDFMIEAAKCLKHQTASSFPFTDSHQDDPHPRRVDDFMRFIEAGIHPPKQTESMLFSNLTMLGAPASVSRTLKPTPTSTKQEPGRLSLNKTGLPVRGKPYRVTHAYLPANRLNALTPLHAIRHGEWVVKIYDPEVEDEDFPAW